jgi:hypothetical protein
MAPCTCTVPVACAASSAYRSFLAAIRTACTRLGKLRPPARAIAVSSALARWTIRFERISAHRVPPAKARHVPRVRAKRREDPPAILSFEPIHGAPQVAMGPYKARGPHDDVVRPSRSLSVPDASEVDQFVEGDPAA